MQRKDVTLSVIIVLLLVAALSINRILLGDSKVVSLATAAPLSGQIAQSLATKDPSNRQKLPVYGTDFTIQSSKYFEANTWVVAKITVSTATNGGVVVLKQQNGVYSVVLGPGTAFPNTVLQAFPLDVSQYLVNSGATYVPVN